MSWQAPRDRRAAAARPRGTWRVAVAVAGVAMLILGPVGCVGEGDLVEEQFDGGTYDRWLFRPEVSSSGGRWIAEDGSLRARLPEGPPARPPLRFAANFLLDGDFEVLADYTIRSLPGPLPRDDIADYDQSNNVELVLRGDRGFVSVYRNHRPNGEGIGFFAQFDDGETAWEHLPASNTSGSLVARRSGNRLELLHGDESGELTELGLIDFGSGTIKEIALSVMALNSPNAIEVAYDRFFVRADSIDRTLQPPRRWAPIAWGAALLLTALVAGSLAWHRISSHRDPSPAVDLRRGFTLIELLVVIALIGLLIALLLGADRARPPDVAVNLGSSPMGRVGSACSDAMMYLKI